MKNYTIVGGRFGEERALYGSRGINVANCVFDGPEDGESAFKECRNVTARDSRFSLRYPLWHCEDFSLTRCTMDEGVRAALWYSHGGQITDTTIRGVKCLRECGGIAVSGCDITSAEFGWRCADVTIRDSSVTAEYFLMMSRDVSITGLKMKGKYSFQYVENCTVDHSVLDTKDAFWHSKNVTVRDSVIRGEYLGWYSENLTLINCTVIGTQPLCYCLGLRLINCATEDCDLAFENSEVEATLRGGIVSIKNPRAGHITVDSCGEIIRAGALFEIACDVTVKEQTK